MAQPSSPAFEVPLGELLTTDQIIEKMDCSTAKQAVEQLVERLAGLELIDAKTTAVKRIMERERLAPTALGSGVAIPHARMEVGDKPIFAIGRHLEGLNFDAPDGQPVKLIFLLLWQPERPGLFNQLFANLVTKLNNPEFRRGLIEANDAPEIIGMLGGVRIQWMQSVETSLDGRMLITLQNLESLLDKKDENKQKLERQIELIRQDLDSSILWRYDRLKKLHGIAVVSVDRGVCGGCYMQLSSGFASEVLKNPDSLFVCEKCGRFLMGDISAT
jgi:mannitol/fructose-specific phosphotransferase system IIA component (Ntr-type)